MSYSQNVSPFLSQIEFRAHCSTRPTFPVTTVSFAIFAAVILMAFIGLGCRNRRRKRLQQHAAQAHTRSPHVSPPLSPKFSPLTTSRVSLLAFSPFDIFTNFCCFQTESISVTPAAYIPPHATPVRRP
ncbi:hypothetical protein BDR07DRAFT_1423110 [Suillus spraguei]|nr:hypothetical protein BDR07DRAFT_1423110 [Suillus spraguei]